MFLSRTKFMIEDRGNRARRFAEMDDQLAGVIPSPSKIDPKPISQPTSIPQPLAAKAPSPMPPALALIGLSLPGPLDQVYKHSLYPTIDVQNIYPSNRKAPGQILLFAHTFKGRFWFTIGWEGNGLIGGNSENGPLARFWEILVDVARTHFLGLGEVEVGSGAVRMGPEQTPRETVWDAARARL